VAAGLAPYTCLAFVGGCAFQSSVRTPDVKPWTAAIRKELPYVIPYPLVRVIAYAIATIFATLILGTISSRLISFDDAATVLLFGLVIGVLDAFIKPVVRLLSLPITCLTFGIFALVINVALFYFGGTVTPGMEIDVWGAIFGSILTSVLAGLMFSVVDE